MINAGPSTLPQFSNRLQHEKSHYLLQHAHNPVDWYPWGEEAFARAAAENRPIFLSIGYATCHWCHVMEKESFEDREVADLLNRDYVCIKVDREERPDIDQVYMDVCTRLTGSGGWPLTIFMTPDKKPFFAGTYFPKQSHPQRPGLVDYLPLIADRWHEQPEEFKQRADQVIASLQTEGNNLTKKDQVTVAIFDQTTKQLLQRYDTLKGGFGDAPKFPSPHNLAYLLRRYRRTGDSQLLHCVTQTLDGMRHGGLFDQVGFGFHRYSTDRHWLVPHFEKMLYDQAGLAQVYLETFQISGDATFAKTAREILSYVLAELTGEQGGFYSAQDADSEGEEGKYYLWTVDEITELLGEKTARLFCELYRLTEEGNYIDESSRQKTGRNIPHLAGRIEQFAGEKKIPPSELSAEIESGRKSLERQRKQRIPPLTDDKILTSWNGMMISALAEGGRILDDRAYISAAETAADFILTALRDPEGNLLRRYRDGEAAIGAFAEDYSFLALGLLDLYRATFKPQHLKQAIELAEQIAERFLDPEVGLIFEVDETHTELIVRPKSLFDGAHPSTNSFTLQLFARLNLLTGETIWQQRAALLLDGLAPYLNAYPAGFTSALQGAALLLEPSRQVVLTGQSEHPTLKDLIRTSNQVFTPESVFLLHGTGKHSGVISRLVPFTQHLNPVKQPAAHICQNLSCQRPVFSVEELKTALSEPP